MNTRQAFTAAALALLASSAFAGSDVDPGTGGFGPAGAKSRVLVSSPVAGSDVDPGTGGFGPAW
jgi:hypothetical protein